MDAETRFIQTVAYTCNDSAEFLHECGPPKARSLCPANSRLRCSGKFCVETIYTSSTFTDSTTTTWTNCLWTPVFLMYICIIHRFICHWELDCCGFDIRCQSACHHHCNSVYSAGLTGHWRNSAIQCEPSSQEKKKEPGHHEQGKGKAWSVSLYLHILMFLSLRDSYE